MRTADSFCLIYSLSAPSKNLRFVDRLETHFGKRQPLVTDTVTARRHSPIAVADALVQTV